MLLVRWMVVRFKTRDVYTDKKKKTIYDYASIENRFT